ncbi:MAG: outer membrane beta-barrel protein [Pseudomonadota bacterium]|nr:outer membrane beta-barrel protein [Pseudomonadota bacterium]
MKLVHTLRPVGAIGLAALGLAVPVYANDEFRLSDSLLVTGFIDMSWTSLDVDGESSEQSVGVEQFEIDFLYDFDDKLSAQVDLEYHDNGTGEEVDIEQAFISYAVTKSFSVKAGRFLSYSGWETEEPTGLYQHSKTGYAAFFYGAYQQGVSGKYVGNGYQVALSVVSDLGDLEGESREFGNPGFEAMLAINPTDTIVAKAFYSRDDLAGTDETTSLVNMWTAYIDGPITLAAEYNRSENAPAYAFKYGVNSEASGYLFMGNYAIDDYAVTLRYHNYTIDNASGEKAEEGSAITIAPSYTVNQNLWLVFEYRMGEQNGIDEDLLAMKALVTF